jgi:hypothetical protein
MQVSAPVVGLAVHPGAVDVSGKVCGVPVVGEPPASSKVKVMDCVPAPTACERRRLAAPDAFGSVIENDARAYPAGMLLGAAVAVPTGAELGAAVVVPAGCVVGGAIDGIVEPPPPPPPHATTLTAARVPRATRKGRLKSGRARNWGSKRYLNERPAEYRYRPASDGRLRRRTYPVVTCVS